jgi:serine 3-dehydrogenase
MTTRTVWITGATSGFGAATVERFVTGGWRVIASGRRADRLQQLVERHGSEHVHATAFDVRDEAAMHAAHASLPPAFAGIDLLVNNAGLALGTAPAQQADLAQWKQMIDTNVTALVSLTHLLLPQLIQRRGAIVNISSIEPGMAETEFTLVRTGGDQAASDNLYAGAHPITASDIADTIWWIANLPPHLNINRVEVMPVSQSAAGLQIARDS